MILKVQLFKIASAFLSIQRLSLGNWLDLFKSSHLHIKWRPLQSINTFDRISNERVPNIQLFDTNSIFYKSTVRRKPFHVDCFNCSEMPNRFKKLINGVSL